MSKVIYLDVDEEITSVIDKIKKVKDQKKIILFFPKRASLTQSIVNLKLLKKQIDLLSKDILVVTSDETGFNLTKKSGFEVRKTLKEDNGNANNVDIEKKEKEEISKINIENFLNNNKESENKSENSSTFLKTDNNLKNDLAKKENKSFLSFLSSKDNFKKKRASRKSNKEKVILLPSFSFRSLLFFFLISCILISIIFFIVLPKATITIVPRLEPFSSDLEIYISGNAESLNQENKIVPGVMEEAEIKSDRKKFNSTGEKDIGVKAKGSVILYNSYSSNPQTLVSSTRLQSQGKTYYLLSEVTIPGAQIEGGKQVPGKIETVIEAEEFGEEYNLSSASFIIPGLALSKQKNIYGESEGSIAGGTSQKIKIITEEDLNKAKDALLAEVSQKGISDIEGKIGSENMIIDNTVQAEIIELNTSGEKEKEMDDFEMELKAKILAMSFKKNDLQELVFTNLNKELSQEKFFINENIEEGINFEKIDFNIEYKKLDLKLHINKEVAWKVDEKVIKKAIKRKTSEESVKYLLENSMGKEAKVDFWPFWVKKVPQIEKKIEIILDTS
jgi:hypothetical protein